MNRSSSGVLAKDWSWKKVTTSANGKFLAAVRYGEDIYTSNDFGKTWVNHSSSEDAAGNRNWWSITMSADGERLAAVDVEGHFYTSSDGGITWVDQVNRLFKQHSTDSLVQKLFRFFGFKYTKVDQFQNSK